jgi:hypothetical protein
MNEQLQSKLVEILTAIQEAARAGGDFAMAQLPDIAQSYVAYGRAQTVYVTIAWLVASVAALALARFAYVKPWNTSCWDHERNRKRSDSNVLVMFLGIGGGFLAALIGVLNFDLLVWVSPKVWLLKEIAGLVK